MVTMTLQDFIRRVKDLDNPDTLWEEALAFCEDRGATMVVYRHFVGVPDPNEVPVVRSHGIPPHFQDKVLKEKLYLVNPVPELAAKSTDPFFWSDIPKMKELLEGEEAFLHDVLHKYIGDGLAIQVFGPQSRNGLLQLSYGGKRPQISQREIKELQMAAQLGHLTYCRMTPDYEQDPHGMTSREREVLHWISQGKSNSVIADILGISVHTVDTHVRRIFRKLDVNDRTTAAVKGMGAGIVQAAA